MYRSRLSKVRPSSLDVWYVVAISLVVFLAGNTKIILEKWGLISSADLIGQQVSTKVLTGNNYIDNFKFTAGVLNLMIWGAAGLIIYSALQAVVRAIRTYEFQRDFDSQLYVHPQHFSRQSYWRRVIIDSLFGFLLLAVFVVATAGYIFVLVPDGYDYFRMMILQPSLAHIPDPFIGYVIIFVGTFILFQLLKLVIRHHRISTVI